MIMGKLLYDGEWVIGLGINV